MLRARARVTHPHDRRAASASPLPVLSPRVGCARPACERSTAVRVSPPVSAPDVEVAQGCCRRTCRVTISVGSRSFASSGCAVQIGACRAFPDVVRLVPLFQHRTRQLLSGQRVGHRVPGERPASSTGFFWSSTEELGLCLAHARQMSDAQWRNEQWEPFSLRSVGYHGGAIYCHICSQLRQGDSPQ